MKPSKVIPTKLRGARLLADTGATETVQRPTKAQRFKIALVIALCTAGVIALSQLLLVHNSIRLDEAQSMWQTSHSLSGTLKVVAQDVHVPLYHLLLHFWQVVFGPSIEVARRMSLLFFILSIPVVYLLARRILSINWSLLVVVLYSFSPFTNWYANEARMYTLLLLMTTLSLYFFTKIIDSRGKKGWLGYVITAVIGVYSHYFFLLNLLTQGIYYLFTRKRFAKGTFLKFAGLAALLIVELIPWFLYFKSQGSASNTSPNLQVPSSIDFVNVLSQFLFGFQNDALNTILVSPWPLLVIVALMFVKDGQKITPKVGLMLSATLLPIIIAYVVSYTVTPLFVSRYMIACIPPLLIAGVWFISHYRRFLAVGISGLLLLALIGTSFHQYRSASTPVKEDYKAAAALISSQADSSDVVVLSAPFTVYPFNYYYQGSARVMTLPLWDRTKPGAIPAYNASNLETQVKQLNKDHQYVYLLLSYDQGYEEQVYQYYEQHYENPRSYQLSPGMRLQVYRVGYSQNKPVVDL